MSGTNKALLPTSRLLQPIMSTSSSNTLTLVLSADDAYAQPLAVTVYSALVHLTPGWTVDLYVIDGGISEANRTRIARVVEAAPPSTTLRWLTPDSNQVHNLPVLDDRMSTSAYLRLCLPDLLPDTCERVLYLDSDVLVTSSLTPLWTEPFDGTALCAVQDYYTPYVSSTRGLDYYRELDLAPHTPYFNSGVMAINLAHWREHSVGVAALQHIEAYQDRVIFQDQGGLNAVVAGNWTPLDPAWNLFVTPDRLKDVPPSEVQETLTARPQLFQTAHIYHFAGGVKPWALDTYHLMQRRWYQYLWQSAWHTTQERWASIAAFGPVHAWRWFSHTVRGRTRPMRHRMAPHLPGPVGSLLRR